MRRSTFTTLILGGAIALLAACSGPTTAGDATLRSVEQVSAARKSDTTSTVQTLSTECRFGYQVAIGRTDSVCVGEDQ